MWLWCVLQNLAKLATAFGSVLKSASVSGDISEGNGGEKDQFTVNDLFTASVASVERSIGLLLLVLDGNTEASLDLTVLKFLKLYWRAFQRIITAFADCLESEVEECVLCIVNVTGSLLYAVRHRMIPVASKPGQELREMLDQALEMTEKMAERTEDGINEQAKASIRTLLWFPAADMVRAVGQRQPREITSVDAKNSIQWAHLLVLTAFAALSGERSLDSDVPYDDSNRAVEVSQLFARYRECTLNETTSRSADATKLLTDLMLQYLLGFDNVVELKLTLLKQTLYPDWTQRALCWEMWRELLCFSWDEPLALQSLEMLLGITQWDEDTSDSSFVLASGVEDEILQLVAFVYADLPLSLKDFCLDQVTAVIDLISNEGPGHGFNLRVASQLNLLERLAGVQFLKQYNGPVKDEWIAKYLPMCFECCGTIIELLSAEAKAPTTKWEIVLGMIRVLDVSLLVLRGVFDDNEPRQDDIAELSSILVRMSTEALSQLAKLSKHTKTLDNDVKSEKKRTSRDKKLEKAGSRCLGRSIETCLYLISKLGPVLKANKNNQCVQAIKDLVVIIDNMNHSDGVWVITARFVKAALFDVQVARGDMHVVWQLLLSLFQKLLTVAHTKEKLLLSETLDALYEVVAHSNIFELPDAQLSVLLTGETKQAFIQNVSKRKLSTEDVLNALEAAQLNTLQALKRSQKSRHKVFRDRFPDESADLYTEPDHDTQGTSAGSNKRSADESKALPQKRYKLTHLVSLCREIESSLSSIDSDETAASLLSGEELENATAVLHKLLAKTMALCP
ncbi:hypothetical protein DVH05_004179 [Phytophthora capsici]|nr:hypothetical protein DVH05_004179 [Phytophthora capsici]